MTRKKLARTVADKLRALAAKIQGQQSLAVHALSGEDVRRIVTSKPFPCGLAEAIKWRAPDPASVIGVDLSETCDECYVHTSRDLVDRLSGKHKPAES